jgi:dihydrodipicolinate synthase/N-acetylneuraminate lyase
MIADSILQNIVGVKLTCGNVGKLTRLTDAFSSSEFAVFGGSSDWLVPGLVAKSCGAVTGLANTHPRSCVTLFDLFQNGKLVEAQELQGLVSKAEWGMGNTGMNGTKYAVEWSGSYKEKIMPRAPLMECSEETKVWIRDVMSELTIYESKLVLGECGSS